MLFFIIWIIFIPLIIWVVLKIISRRKGNGEVDPSVQLEECALCHEDFPMDALLEKEVGGYSRVYCFCGDCIEQLHREYQAKVRYKDEGNERISESTPPQ